MHPPIASRAAPLALAGLFFLSSLSVSALAQAQDESRDLEALEEERAGTSRGSGYAWGDSNTDVPGVAGPVVHRYARIFASIGAGGTLRIVQYEPLAQERFAPPYLQLRGAYFFDGDGDLQHGIGLGISTLLNADGAADVPGLRLGLDPFTAWTFVPQYILRIWFGDWVQLMGRVGLAVTASDLPNLGFEVGVAPVIKFTAGIGIYLDVSFSGYFANDFHPLVSADLGLVIDYELLP